LYFHILIVFLGLVRKNVDSPYFVTFHKFLKDPEGLKRENLTEAPDKPPEPTPGMYAAGTSSPDLHTPATAVGKKLYIPPYTPRATTVKREGEPDNVKVSATGFSRYISALHGTYISLMPQRLY
jgi:hypothetical protein